jgi:valyl-tRNA synthetase
VEAAKTDIFADDVKRKNSALAVMDYVLSATLRLLHPFMPHITEELWTLLGLGENSIQFATPPAVMPLTGVDVEARRRLVQHIYETVQANRNLRAEARIPSNKKVDFFLHSIKPSVEPELPTLARLSNAAQVTPLQSTFSGKIDMPMAVTSLGETYLHTLVEDVSGERERLTKEIERVEEELKTVRGKLANESFVQRAPAVVVEEHRQRERNFGEQLTKLQEARQRLG